MTYKVFISSRNKDNLFINGLEGSSLTDIRLFLKKELEKEELFGEKFLEIIINETFDSDTTNDSYSECLKQIEEAHYTIALLNGSSGWAAPSIEIGICHAELAKAFEVSPKIVSVIDLTDYFNYSTTDTLQEKRDEAFNEFIQKHNRFNNPLKIPKNELSEETLKTYLLEKIKNIISKSLEKRVEASNYSFKLNPDTQKLLEWKGLSFESLDKEITNLLSKVVKKDYADVITVTKSIPANMSTSEALNFSGRSFSNDQDTIQEKKNKRFKKGPIHFVGVYGNVTENQIKALIGNPDIATIKGEFGYYVWERDLNIQMIFLSKCATAETTIMNYYAFKIWCDANGLSEVIIKRAEARYIIVQAFNKAKAHLIE